MKMSDLKINKKKRKTKKRLGKGIGSGWGKTAGKGHKGQNARSGAGKPPWFEGGQQRLTQLIPKSGFKNIFKKEFEIINTSILNEKFEAGAEITKEILFEKGLISSKTKKLKILGDGDLVKALKVKADKFSKSAEEKIKKAGGTTEVLICR